MTSARLVYAAADGVSDVVAGIGRTEDLALSPDNGRLVILDYFGKQLFVFSLRIDTDAPRQKVTM